MGLDWTRAAWEEVNRLLDSAPKGHRPPWAEALILMYVADRIKNGEDTFGRAKYQSLDHLVKDLGLSFRTVRRHVDRLVDLGYLEIKDPSSPGRKAVYRPAFAPKPLPQTYDRSRGSQVADPGTSQTYDRSRGSQVADPGTSQTYDRYDGHKEPVTVMEGHNATGVTASAAQQQPSLEECYREVDRRIAAGQHVRNRDGLARYLHEHGFEPSREPVANPATMAPVDPARCDHPSPWAIVDGVKICRVCHLEFETATESRAS